jgi:hypothetical protein
MKSAILNKGEEYYTYMGKIFNAIENEQIKYNWLITNCECYPQDKNIYKLFSTQYLWISGIQLTKIILNEDFQFIWGVFSGFSPGVTLKEVLEYDLPFANGYEGFWENSVGIQHPLADIEIVAFDSSYTLFISKDDSLVQKFRHSFPLSQDLSVKNTRDNSELAFIEELLKKELLRKNLGENEKILHQKYTIWHKLYSDKKNEVKDVDILRVIDEILNRYNRT